MDTAKTYLVPDYFFDFHCKMGECRNACCEGWPISVSLRDYFMLLGADVSKNLRIKLDCALHIAPNPSPEAYAQILPGYDGRCPMRMEDGRCALHYELGEYALSDVCRLYPRGVRSNECSCANSCEAVVELLMDREEKIRFYSRQMDFHIPKPLERKHFFETAACESEIRMHLISILQNRDYTIAERIAYLGMTLKMLDDALRERKHNRVKRIIEGEEQIKMPYSAPVMHDDLLNGLEVADHMLEALDERSESIRQYGENALSFFEHGEHAFRSYTKGKAGFENAFANWQVWFEHMLVNHMFFSQFPFQDRPVDLMDEFLALSAVYMLLRFLLIGNETMTKEKAADIAAAVFRLVEHTEFDRYAVPMLKKICGADNEKAMRILCL